MIQERSFRKWRQVASNLVGQLQLDSFGNDALQGGGTAGSYVVAVFVVLLVEVSEKQEIRPLYYGVVIFRYVLSILRKL